MSEYIKREDAKQAILGRENHSMIHDYEFNNGLIDACNAIDDIPSADVVEVVRCKDCRYWRSDGECIMHSNYTINAIYGADENDYCSYGEREDGESE